MAVSMELLRDTKVKLHLLLTQKASKTPGEALLLKTLGEDSDVLSMHAVKREAWTELCKPLPVGVGDVFGQA